MSGFYRFIAWILVLAAALVGGLRATAIRWVQIPINDLELGASLEPTLSAGDWVLVWRLTMPSRGDLVLCPDPDDPTNVLIGRIAGTSGDDIELNGQIVRINNKVPTIEYNCTERTFSFTDPDTHKVREGYCDMEELFSTLHKRGNVGDVRDKTRLFKKKVGPGQVFLLSDNRASPLDSRHVGTLERITCRETIFFRLVSQQGFSDVEHRLEYIR